jgi:hypothetical protein
VLSHLLEAWTSLLPITRRSVPESSSCISAASWPASLFLWSVTTLAGAALLNYRVGANIGQGK